MVLACSCSIACLWQIWIGLVWCVKSLAGPILMCQSEIISKSRPECYAFYNECAMSHAVNSWYSWTLKVQQRCHSELVKVDPHKIFSFKLFLILQLMFGVFVFTFGVSVFTLCVLILIWVLLLTIYLGCFFSRKLMRTLVISWWCRLIRLTNLATVVALTTHWCLCTQTWGTFRFSRQRGKHFKQCLSCFT